MNIIKKYCESLRRHKKAWILISVLSLSFGTIILLSIYLFIGSYDKYISNNSATLAERIGHQSTVGVVLGGGVENGKPRPLLKDRLDTSAKLLKSGIVKKLILSGDNRYVSYNEPEVMKNYLVNQQKVDVKLIQLDNAGRSTYETCERSIKVFGLNKVLLISESTHLPRAIYLCRSFGIEAYGYSSDGQSSAGLKIGQRFRELLARVKAVINVYIVGEHTVLGYKISV